MRGASNWRRTGIRARSSRDMSRGSVRISESARRLLPGRAPTLVAAVVGARPAGRACRLPREPAWRRADAVVGADGGRAADAGRPPARLARASWTGTGKIAYAYQWYRCDTMGAHCAVLRGVTQRRRVVGPADVGHTLSLAVRATDSGGSTTAYASLVGPDRGQAGRARAEDAAVGLRRLGARRDRARRPRPLAAETVRRSASSGRAAMRRAARARRSPARRPTRTRSPRPTSAIRSSRSSRRARTRRRGRCSASRRLSPSPSAARRARPARPSRWWRRSSSRGRSCRRSRHVVGLRGASATRYQWYRCDPAGAHCTGIRGATATSYTPGAKDVGQTLGFAVRARDAVGASTAYANLIGPIAAVGAALASAGQPTVTGAPTQGQTLLVSAGGWTQTPGALAYQWQRCNANGRVCAPIAGATAPTYVSTAEDVGHVLLAVVHASGRAERRTRSAPPPVRSRSRPARRARRCRW